MNIFMKKLVVKDRTLCKDCLSCEVTCSQAFYKDYQENSSCIKIGFKKYDSLDVKVCNQCGLCARKCPQEAIKQNANGVYMINKKLCNEFLTYVEACPKWIIAKVEEKEVPSKCIACGICVDLCPMDILTIQES